MSCFNVVFKTIVALIFIFATALIPPTARAGEAKQLILGHIGAPGTMYDLTANEFARRVNAKLAGRYEIVVKGNSSIGDDEAMLSQVRKGEICFSLPFAPLAKAMPIFAAFDLPYLILTRNHIREVRAALVETYLKPEAEKNGLALVAMWENGFRHVTSSGHAVEGPRDLRGLKLRIPPGSWRSQIFQSFGADITEIPLKKLYDALKNKEVDGEENTLTIISSSNYSDVQQYLSLTAHSYQPIFLVASNERFSHLEPDVRQVIISVSKDLENWALDIGAREDLKQLSELRKKMIVNDPDKFSFLVASIPIYQEFARQIPNGIAIVKMLYDPSSFGASLVEN